MKKIITVAVTLFTFFNSGKLISQSFNTCDGSISYSQMGTSSATATQIGAGAANTNVVITITYNALSTTKCAGLPESVRIITNGGTNIAQWYSTTTTGTSVTMTSNDGYAKLYAYCLQAGSDALISWYTIDACGVNICNGTAPTFVQMSNTPITTCSATFTDPGGCSANYSNSQDFTQTFCPSTINSCINVKFTSFALETSSSCASDYLKVYDGSSTSDPLLGTYCGNTSPGTITPSNTNTSGCLTFVFHSNGTTTGAGWIANVTCGTCPVYCPTGSCPTGTTCDPVTHNCIPNCTPSTTVTPTNDCVANAELITNCGVSFYTCNYNATSACACKGTTTGGGFWNDLDCNAATGAFSSGGDVGYSVESDIWYKFCPTQTGAWTLNIEPSQCSTTGYQYAVFYGSPTSLTLVAGGANGMNITTSSSINFNVTQTTSCYYVQIDGYAGDECVFAVNVGPTVPGPCNLAANGVTICSGNTATLTATGTSGATFNWYAAASGGSSLFTGNPFITPTLTTTTTYYVTETVSGTEGARTGVTVTVNANPTVSVNSSSYCPGGSATLTASGASTYAWSPSTGLSATTGSTVTASTTVTTTYTVTGTDGNGCTGTATSTVTINPTPTVSVNSPSYCAPGSASLTATGASTYAWSPSTGLSASTGSPVTASPTVTTTYTVTGTAVNGCTATANSTVTVNATPTVSVNSPSICTGSSTALNATGATAYAWSPSTGLSSTSGSPVTANPTVTTTYTVTGTSGTCTSTAQSTVTVNSLPVANVAPPAQITCTVTSVTLDGSASDSGPNIAYDWTTTGGNITAGGTTNSATVNAAGTYSLTVTNTVTGCSAVTSVTVTTSSSVPIAIVSTPAPLTCTITSVTLDGSGSSSGLNYTYSWTTSNGNITGTTITNTTTVDAAGTYVLTVTDIISNCSATYNALVVSNTTPPHDSIIPPAQLTCSNTSITLDGSQSVSGAGISYNWSTADGNITSSDLTADTVIVDANGTYVLTVTDAATGCVSTASVTVSTNTLAPVASIVAPSKLECDTTSLVIDGSGSSAGATIYYAWAASSGGHIASGATTNSPTIDSAGIYTLTIIDSSNGCSATANVTVAIDTTKPQAIIASPSQITCSADTVTLDGTGSSSGSSIYYSWSTSGGTITSATNADTASVNANGTYMLTVTDSSNGCSANASVTVSSSTVMPTAAIVAPAQITCKDTVLILDGSGSSQGPKIIYSWTTVGGTITSGTANDSATVSSTGDYSILVTDTSNGCSASFSVTVTSSNTPPVANVAVPSQLTCSTPTVALDGTGSSSGINIIYNWSTTGGNITAGGTTDSASAGAAGTYTLTVADTSTGCSDTASVTVIANAGVVTASIVSPVGPYTCKDTTFALDASASTSGTNITYNWITFDGGITTGSTTNTATVNSAGTYFIIVKDTVSNCTDTASVVIAADTVKPNNNPGAPQSITCTTTSVTLTGASSSSNVRFDWSGPSGYIDSAAVVTGNSAGTYTLVVTDTLTGCSKTDSVIISLNTAPPTVSAGNDQTITCTTTTVTLTGATNASSPGYNWNGPGTTNVTTASLSNISQAGTYTLSVTDSTTGCSNIDSVTVLTNTTVPTATATASAPAITCLTTSVTLTGSTNAGSSTITWSGLTGNPATTSTAGTYTVTVTDNANGCSNTATVTVIPLTNTPTVTAGSPNDTINCANPSASLTGTSNPSTGVTYSWSGPGGYSSNQQNPTGITTTGTYTLAVTITATGCSSTSTVTIFQGADPVAGFSANPTTGTVPLTVNFTNTSTGSSVYMWSFGDLNTSSSVNPSNIYIANGTYTVMLVTSNGIPACNDTATATIVVIEPATVLIPNVFSPNGDGINDLFSVQSTGLTSLHVDIMDRWGLKVGEINGVNGSWNGKTTSGSASSDGTYFFILTAKGIDGSDITKQGYLLLTR